MIVLKHTSTMMGPCKKEILDHPDIKANVCLMQTSTQTKQLNCVSKYTETENDINNKKEYQRILINI